MEHQSELQGVDIVEDYKRVYNDSVYFASLLGYTGKASTEELEQLRKQSDNYSSSSIRFRCVCPYLWYQNCNQFLQISRSLILKVNEGSMYRISPVHS